MPFPVTRDASVSAAPGLLISAAVHLALVGAFLLEPSAGERASSFEDPLPQGLTFLVPPSERSVRSQPTPRYRDLVGDEGDAEGSREGERADRNARRTGVSAARSAGADVAATETEGAAASESPSDAYANAFTDVDVDSAAERHPDSAAPVYPPDLMRLGVEGHASVRFVVDTTGRVDLESVQIIEASRPEFARAVIDAIPGMKFTPARIGTIKVRQLAEQLFRFVIQRSVPPAAKAIPPDAH